MKIDRRHLIQAGALAGLCAAGPGLANGLLTSSQPTFHVNPGLLGRAKAALEYHRRSIAYTDVIGIADFSMASRDPRFYLVSMNEGWVTAFHVAHGRGSDPDHSGWLERFSNDFGSYASSSGTYLTGDFYHGKYGRSMRLQGLDPSNSNALDRAIVVHSAWYAEPEVVNLHGKLGRSEGCFAFSEANLRYILWQLGPGRMIYADKVPQQFGV